MRIISVKFLNLNSLKGVHEIRFDKPPFTESGLFAITGPTGAGKTTILDAITVALYGKVHRHGKDVEEIMSRHTGECYSEVEFEVNEKLYRAKWLLKRSRGKADGAMQAEKMELAVVATGEFLGGHTITSVKQAIVLLSGLDYNQFLRSVILSQGDFTRFLKADDNERSDLLEKITDTGIYSEISRFVFEKQRNEREKLDALSAKQAGVLVLSDEELSVHQLRLTELKSEEGLVKIEQTVVTNKINWLKNIANLHQKKIKAADELTQSSDLFEDNKPDFERLKQHVKAQTFLPDLVELNRIQGQVGKADTEFIELEVKLPEFKQQVISAQDNWDIAGKSALKAQQSLTEIEPLFDTVNKLDTDIGHAAEQVRKGAGLVNQSTTELHKLSDDEKQRSGAIGQMEARKTELDEWLTTHDSDKELEKRLVVFQQYNKELKEVASGLNAAQIAQKDYLTKGAEIKKFIAENARGIEKFADEVSRKEKHLSNLKADLTITLANRTVEQVQEDADELPDLISNCEKQFRIADEFKKNKENQLQLTEELKKLHSSSKEQTAAFIQLSSEKDAATSHLEDLRKLVESELRIKNYEADRALLKPGEPCSLCGSIHHPLIEANYQSALTEAETKRNTQEKKVTELNKLHAEKGLEVNGITLKIETKTTELAKLISGSADLRSEFEQTNSLLPAALDIENTELINALIRKKKNQLGQFRLQLDTIRKVEKGISSTQNTLAESQQALLSAQGNSGKYAENLKAIENDLERISDAIEDARTKESLVMADIKSLLKSFEIEFDKENVNNIESQLINRWGVYHKAITDLQELNLDLATRKTELSNTLEQLKAKVNEQKKHVSDNQAEQEKLKALQLDRKNLFGDKSPLAERERLNNELKKAADLRDHSQTIYNKSRDILKENELRFNQLVKDLHELKQTHFKLYNTLLDKLVEGNIESVEALKALFLPEEIAKQIAETEKRLEGDIKASTQLLASIQLEFEVESVKNLTTESEETLLPQSQNLEKAISELNQEIGGINNILEQDNQLKAKFAELAEALQLQKKEHLKWAKLSDLIGSADGKKFRRFAQGLTLARLTDLANRHLDKLSDRYRILKSKTDDLELLIIDGYQADVVRPMATLSGGESFLVSLALALGLSDLASRKVQINSLFIDEGFGTLDADTLDVAISALENLQSKGKNIGVISHVEALKDRIGTQIQLTKQPGGSSKIKLISYMKEFVV